MFATERHNLSLINLIDPPHLFTLVHSS